MKDLHTCEWPGNDPLMIRYHDEEWGIPVHDDVRKRGFKFAGTTICYSFMQAAGMVNDHLINCFRYRKLKG